MYVNLFWKQGCAVWKGSWRSSYKDIESLLSASISEQPRSLNKTAWLKVLETQGKICPQISLPQIKDPPSAKARIIQTPCHLVQWRRKGSLTKYTCSRGLGDQGFQNGSPVQPSHLQNQVNTFRNLQSAVID